MQKSTYYDLNLVEGADVYNPLVNDVPNYETIDQVMHDNAVAGVTVATELASGNVHAITRSNPECAVIRFVATSDWKTNDRMTIDGTEVTVRMLDGTVLKNNAYIINSNVLGVLTGTLFTVYAVPFVPENASDIRFNDEENVHDAIIKDREEIELLNNKALTNVYEIIGTHVGTSDAWTYTPITIQGGWNKYQRIVVICKNANNNITSSTEVMINDITEVPSIYVMAMSLDNTKYAYCDFFNNGIVYIGAVGTNITCEVRGFIK